jgi:hypothetical protein
METYFKPQCIALLSNKVTKQMESIPSNKVLTIDGNKTGKGNGTTFNKILYRLDVK